MSLQELIKSTELDMSSEQVKAFFLGTLCAEKPLNFSKAVDELVSTTPEAKDILERELKVLWDKLSTNTGKSLKDMYPDNKDTRKFLEVAKDQLDYFLMGMSLAGTSLDNCKSEDLAAFLDEMEDCLEDIEDFLSDKKAEVEEGETLKEFLVEGWDGYVATKRSN